MAVASVSLAEALRPWSAAGLSFFLLEGPLDVNALTARPSAPVDAHPRPGAPSTVKPSPTGAALPEMPQGTAGANRAIGSSSVVSGGESRPPESANPSSQTVSRVNTPIPATSTEHPNPFADSATWPEPWRLVFAKVKPAPLAWTYHELGADLSGLPGGEQRAALFRSIIAELQLPRGTSTFWPTAVPMEQGNAASCAARPELFSAGLALLAPRIVVVFGKQALEDMDLPTDAVGLFQQRMVGGRLLIHVPAIDMLLDDAAQVRSTVSLLRAVLGSLNLGA